MGKTKKRGFIRSSVSSFLGRSSRQDKPTKLFDGDDALFIELGTRAKNYAEYGVGLSTLWMAQNTQARILGVDTSQEWRDKISALVGEPDRIDLRHTDVGPVADWGHPKTYEKRNKFYSYVESIWTRNIEPDMVLIDGRFRVCCFLTSLGRAQEGTVLLFDDYRDRPLYHVVEEFVQPFKHCGRQAAFLVPANVDQQYVLNTAERFLYVID
jgi:hypothetical protein